MIRFIDQQFVNTTSSVTPILTETQENPVLISGSIQVLGDE